MEQFLKELSSLGSMDKGFTLLQSILVLLSSLISSIIITQVYKKTFKGIAYSQSFVQTLIIMEITVSIIMLAVGTNIARAFSLAGALSIIRFRVSIKDPKDIGFVFFAMAAGMAIGAQYYVLGLIFTLVLSTIIFILYKIDYAYKPIVDKILRIVIPEELKREKIEAVIGTYVNNYYMASRENVGDKLAEVIYIIEEKNDKNNMNLINELQKINNGQKVAIVEGYEKIDI